MEQYNIVLLPVNQVRICIKAALTLNFRQKWACSARLLSDLEHHNQAYNHPDTSYDHEYLFVLSEMDPAIHHKVDFGQAVDNNNYKPVLWFINGRNAPDTMADAGVPWLPNQPYNSLPRVRPGDIALMRFVSVSRHSHPFHTHGNHYRLLARDGNLLESTPGGATRFITMKTSRYMQYQVPPMMQSGTGQVKSLAGIYMVIPLLMV